MHVLRVYNPNVVQPKFQTLLFTLSFGGVIYLLCIYQPAEILIAQGTMDGPS